jgi:hypothetical protein
MIAFPANIKRRIKVNREDEVRQWPQWFLCGKVCDGEGSLAGGMQELATPFRLAQIGF